MFVQERQKKIIDLLEENGRVLVRDLSMRFSVTEDCIRKDLAALEKNSLLKRVYGGAVTERINTHQLKAEQRKDTNVVQKKIIAKKALELIKTGDTIFLDISTVNVEVARLLLNKKIKVNVITNMIDIMNLLAAHKYAEMTFIGGTLDFAGDGFIGGLANGLIDKLHFDAAFMGAVGIDVHKNAVYTYKPEDGLTKKKAVDSADKAYILAENEKFMRSGNFLYASLNDFTAVVTEKPLSRQAAKKIKEYRIKNL